MLSPEAIQAVQSLKLAKSPGKLAEVFANRISRLMKADLLDTLYELQRQNEVELALQVNVCISCRDCFGFVGLIIFCKGIVEFDEKRIEGLKKKFNFVGIIICFGTKK